MTDPQTKPQLIEQLQQIQQRIHTIVQTMTDEQFNREGADGTWSAAGYLKHLILSVKPFAKALTLGPDGVMRMTGQPDHPSRTYAELVAIYKAGIAAGVRAERVPTILPVSYRFPDGVTDEHAYLLDTWDEANNRLISALDGWDEAQLDTHQLPHPAIGLLTIREMLFFTVYHNTLHGDDIQQAGEAALR